ncbi:hypothetical protein J2S13_000497 [Oikeobacillus pervagus]|uniref:Uncharacterized protein n=1 Tax=Oikeobacillus pervagus TaxID=1325931 RepID=A0AAJ1T2J1_9BACI|nr:hypothetical protein [Oikeobacillus pervagus]MDQ0214101.1 hypothetical protein [Oikeobacillus pervagus]
MKNNPCKKSLLLVFCGKRMRNNDQVEIVSFCHISDVLRHLANSEYFLKHVSNKKYVEFEVRRVTKFLLTIQYLDEQWEIEMEVSPQDYRIQFTIKDGEKLIPEEVIELVTGSFLIKQGRMASFLIAKQHPSTSFHRPPLTTRKTSLILNESTIRYHP